MPSIALLKKELLTQLRRVRSIGWLVLLAVLMIWWVAAGWPRTEYQLIWANIGRYTQNIFYGVSMMLFVGSALFVPGIAATSIVVEKEQESWDPLFVTLISSRGIFWGKLFSAIGMYLLFIVATFPVVSAIFFLVGVDWVQFLFAYGMILVTTVTCGVIGVACSARFRSTLWAVFFSYLGVAILMGLVPLILALVVEMFIRPFTNMSFPFSDYETLMFTFSALITLAAGLDSYNIPLVSHLVFQAALAFSAYIWGARAIRRPTDPAVERGGAPVDDQARLKERRRRFPFYLLDPLKRPKPIEDEKNPVCEKELRWGFLRRRSLATRLSVVFFLISMAISTFTAVESVSRGWTEILMLSLVQGAVVCAFIPVFLSHLFPKEIDRGNLDMLRMTLLSPEDVAKGKYQAGLRMAGWLMVLTVIADLPILFVALASGYGRVTWMFISGVVSLTVCLLLTLGVTMRISVMVRRTGPAIVASLIGSVLALFGAMMVGFLLAATFDVNLRSDRGPGLFISYTSPVMAYVYESGLERIAWRHLYWALNVIVFLFLSLALRRRAFNYYAQRRWQDR